MNRSPRALAQTLRASFAPVSAGLALYTSQTTQGEPVMFDGSNFAPNFSENAITYVSLCSSNCLSRLYTCIGTAAAVLALHLHPILIRFANG